MEAISKRVTQSLGFSFGQQVRIDYNAGSFSLAETWVRVDNQAALFDDPDTFLKGVYQGFNKWFSTKIERG